MIRDRIAIDLPAYLHLLAGHYFQDTTYYSSRPEGTDDWLLIATAAGTGEFGVHTDALLYTMAGRVVLLPPGCVHNYRTGTSGGNWELLWVHFNPRPHWFEWLEWPRHSNGVMYLDIAPDGWTDFLSCFNRMYTWAASAAPHGCELAMNGLEELLLRCHSLILQRKQLRDTRILDVIQFIHHHLEDELSVDALARFACLSSSRLAHLFRNEVGISPLQYIDLQRVEKAKQLLVRTRLPIGQIAGSVGMDSIYFSQRFKLHTGISPREYRKLQPSSNVRIGEVVAAE